MRVIVSCLTVGAAFSANQSSSEILQSGDGACEQSCYKKGYTCKAVVNNQNGASTYNHPSCAMGCYMGKNSYTAGDCKTECDKNDNTCYWLFRATQMSNCGSDDNCPGQSRRGSTNAECKIGCDLAGPYLSTQLESTNGPVFDPAITLARVNQIRSQYGKGPATWNYVKQPCADKEAVYNSAHGAHSCGSKCACGYRAAGDFNANDLLDAINRAYDSRKNEGKKDANVCDTSSHCGALLQYNSITVGFDKNNFYAVIQYFDSSDVASITV